jgi:two-component system LytT family sensor kinase
MSVNRDWRLFWSYSAKSLKYAAIATLLVPIYFILMNPQFSEPHYWDHLLFSSRIGLQISLFHWLCSTLIYSGCYLHNPQLIVVIKKNLPLQLLKGLVLMVIALAISAALEPHISGRSFGLQSFTVGALVGGITFALVLFYIAYQQTREHNLQLRASTAESNLKVLRDQMQPHFLFNSLNSLAELIDTNSEAASSMVQTLADLYREILEASKSHLCPLESELRIIQKYLELEKLRFGSRLQFTIDISGLLETACSTNFKGGSLPLESQGVPSVWIPSLALQTIIENSIKHRISKVLEKGYVCVSIAKTDQGYWATIRDSGAVPKDWRGVHKTPSLNTGLANLQTRLQLFYGDRSQFQIQVTEEETIVQFWFSGLLETAHVLSNGEQHGV